MPLTESAKKKYFGNTEPQQRRDYSSNGNLQYEGYATPGVATSTAGWVIFLHTLDAVTNQDIQSQPKFGLIWDLRSIYNYNSP